MKEYSCWCAAVLALTSIAVAQQPQPASAREADEQPEGGAEVRDQLDELRAQNEGLSARLDAMEMADLELERTGLGASYGEVNVDFKLFGNVDFAYVDPAEQRGGSELGNGSFQLGVLDFFFTAQIGDNIQVLSETKAEGGGGGDHLSQERLWGSYRTSEALYLKMGLEHSEISRWNRQYHHGSWLEPTIRRPFLASFEGDGGILAMHNVGLELGGDVSTDSGTLHYFSVLSNGRGEDPTQKQKAEDLNDQKAVEAGISLEPDAVENLRIGAALRFDDLNPTNSAPIDEFVTSAYVDYRAGSWESLAEFAFIRDDVKGGQTYNSRSAYLQVGYRTGDWTPYARYDFKNMAEGNPFYAPKDRDLDAWQQTFGVRYDFSPYATLKFEVSVGSADERDPDGVISSDNTRYAGVQLSWAI